jgi:putative addiction module component (TIGR02574 family)
MAKTLERIAQEVAIMTRQERLTLVRLLLDLDQPVNGDEIAHAWDSEIRARVKAVDEGRVSGIPYDQIKKEITDRLGSR